MPLRGWYLNFVVLSEIITRFPSSHSRVNLKFCCAEYASQSHHTKYNFGILNVVNGLLLLHKI